jgi:phosphoglycolate phosphatase
MLSDEFMGGYHARKLECTLRPEANAVLEGLQAAGLEQVIISAAQQSMVEELLDHFKIRPYFSSVLGLDNHHAAGKIEVGVAWLEKQDIDLERVVLIGDTYHDFKVAETMGVDCLLMYSGHQSIGKLRTAGTKVVTALDQIEFETGEK